MSEDLIKDLDNLKQQANEAKRQRDEYGELAKKYAKERDVKNAEIAALLNQAKEKKNIRDKYNVEVADLKSRKEELEKKIEQLTLESDKLNEELKALNPPRITLAALNNKIKELEWRLQTTVLPLDKENSIVKEISELEKLAELKRKAEALKDQIIVCKTQIESSRIILRNIKNGVISSAKSSQSEHNSMTGIYKNVDEIRKQADELHNNFIEAKKKGDEYHNQYIAAKKEMRKILDEIHKLKMKDKQDRQKNIELKLDQMVKTAQEKLKSGEKLSFDEFQMLMEKGLI